LNDIELNRRVPSTYVLQDLARELELSQDVLLMLAGAGETVMHEYLKEHPQQEEEVIQLFVGDSKTGSDCGRSLSKSERTAHKWHG
jgi:hypothetical protein